MSSSSVDWTWCCISFYEYCLRGTHMYQMYIKEISWIYTCSCVYYSWQLGRPCLKSQRWREVRIWSEVDQLQSLLSQLSGVFSSSRQVTCGPRQLTVQPYEWKHWTSLWFVMVFSWHDHMVLTHGLHSHGGLMCRLEVVGPPPPPTCCADEQEPWGMLTCRWDLTVNAVIAVGHISTQIDFYSDLLNFLTY